MLSPLSQSETPVRLAVGLFNIPRNHGTVYNLTCSQSSSTPTPKNYSTRPLIPPATQANCQFRISGFGFFWFGVAETFVSLLSCCGVYIASAFSIFCFMSFGDCTRPQHQEITPCLDQGRALFSSPHSRRQKEPLLVGCRNRKVVSLSSTRYGVFTS